MTKNWPHIADSVLILSYSTGKKKNSLSPPKCLFISVLSLKSALLLPNNSHLVSLIIGLVGHFVSHPSSLNVGSSSPHLGRCGGNDNGCGQLKPPTRHVVAMFGTAETENGMKLLNQTTPSGRFLTASRKWVLLSVDKILPIFFSFKCQICKFTGENSWPKQESPNLPPAAPSPIAHRGCLFCSRLLLVTL